MDGVQSPYLDVETLDDSALVTLAQERHAGAFRAIMTRNSRRLFRIARSVVRDDAEAEDVVQEAYVRAFAAFAAFRNQASVSTWLTRIVLNEAVGRLRLRGRVVSLAAAEVTGETEAAAPPLHSGDEASDPEHRAARAEIRRMLERAVDTLPASFRLVFVLRDVEEMTVEETASALGLRQETVKTRLHRARRLLRSRLHLELGGDLTHAFPFGGQRCRTVSDAVLLRLGAAL